MLNRKSKAFTLIELLVVIAIISLLVGILLPALKNARQLARLTQSQSNLKNVAASLETYRSDHKGIIPYMVPANMVPATWSFAGKDCNVWWQSGLGGFYDFPARTRPLNTYIDSSVVFDSALTAANRQTREFPVLRSPGDVGSAQRTFPLLNRTITSYDDVGTSYHYNGRWYEDLPSASSTQWSRYSLRLSQAFGKLVESSGVNTSRFVLLHDQTADIVSNDPSRRNWTGEFGDRNRSVMSFLDGHVDYLNVVPGMSEGPGYTFKFPRIVQIPGWIRPDTN